MGRLGNYNSGLWILFTAICIAVVLLGKLGPYRYGVAHKPAPA